MHACDLFFFFRYSSSENESHRVACLSTFWPYTARIIPGTELQRRAFESTTANDTFRALLIGFSSAHTTESRVSLCPVAPKTVTIADVIVLDLLCPVELTTA